MSKDTAARRARTLAAKPKRTKWKTYPDGTRGWREGEPLIVVRRLYGEKEST